MWAKTLRDQPLAVTRVVMNSQKAAWGLAFYDGDEILLRKRPEADTADLDWADLASNVQSDCILAQVRVPKSENFRIENTQPFRFRRWSFAHVGSIDRLYDVAAELRATLPDFINRNIRGDTDSELIFHLLLATMYENNQLDSVDAETHATLEAIHRSKQRLTEVMGESAQQLSFVLTNGRQMYAHCLGSRLHYLHRGDTDKQSNDAYLLLTGPLTDEVTDFNTMEHGSILVANRSLEIQVFPT